MGLVRTVDPSAFPVQLSEAKKQCELPEFDSTHNEHIERLIGTATRDVERHTRRALINQTWRLTLTEWPLNDPRDSFPYRQRVYLPRPQLASVTSIIYVNDSGSSTTLSGSLYSVSTDNKPGFVEPAFGQSWPTVRPETPDAIKITYVAGFGANYSSVPDEFQNIIYELVAFRFMNRGDVDIDIPKHIKWALDSLRCGAQYDYFGVKG